MSEDCPIKRVINYRTPRKKRGWAQKKVAGLKTEQSKAEEQERFQTLVDSNIGLLFERILFVSCVFKFIQVFHEAIWQTLILNYDV